MSEPQWFRDATVFGVRDDAGEVIARNRYHNVETADGIKQRVFPGIFVDPKYRGAGLAGQLTKHALDITIEEGYRIVPICPYIVDWVRDYDGGAYLKYSDAPGPEHSHAS